MRLKPSDQKELETKESKTGDYFSYPITHIAKSVRRTTGILHSWPHRTAPTGRAMKLEKGEEKTNIHFSMFDMLSLSTTKTPPYHSIPNHHRLWARCSTCHSPWGWPR